jgi:ABC-type multidrug transport system ATPase subunit
LQLLLGNPEFLIITSPLSGVLPKDAQKIRELIKYFGETHTVFLCTPSVHDLCQMCDEILILQDGMLKTITPATAEDLLAEYANATAESSPTPDVPKKRKNTRWSMLTQKSGDYELLDADEKEDEK